MQKADIGVVGLGTMGAALALNIAESGFRVALFNRTDSVTQDLVAGAGRLAENLVATKSLEDLVNALSSPRAILLMVPAGDVVDDHIARLRPLLDDADMIIDGGNANFSDTIRRAEEAEDKGQGFLGIGVSGGEEGARHGPSIMGGGTPQAWKTALPILQAIAADFDGTPCASYMGPDGAGHFVKTVHNGIEYADMQMIAEIYGLLRDSEAASYDEIAGIFDTWNQGALQSYLVEITAQVAAAKDSRTNAPLLQVIEDTAGQKGTGRWTAIEAHHLSAPVTVIEAAVSARNISALKAQRQQGQEKFGAAPEKTDPLSRDALEGALIAGKIICYAQGFDLLRLAGDKYGWALPLPEVAKVWRAGCIIRSAMLDDMAQALSIAPDLNLMLAPSFADRLQTAIPHLRAIVGQALMAGHAVPALSAALSYFDMMRTGRGTADMIQGQRDYFGRHGFARLDDTGRNHHGPWAE